MGTLFQPGALHGGRLSFGCSTSELSEQMPAEFRAGRRLWFQTLGPSDRAHIQIMRKLGKLLKAAS